MWVSCSPPIARVQQSLIINFVWCTPYINREVDPCTDITFRGNIPTTSLFSSDVVWIFSKQIIFKKWYFRTNVYVTNSPRYPGGGQSSYWVGFTWLAWPEYQPFHLHVAATLQTNSIVRLHQFRPPSLLPILSRLHRVNSAHIAYAWAPIYQCVQSFFGTSILRYLDTAAPILDPF